MRGQADGRADHPAVAARASTATGFARHLATGAQHDPRRARRADGDARRRQRVPGRGRDHAQRTWPEQPFFTAYLRDITAAKNALAERERLEQQLRQAQKMEAIGSLAGGVAHDFNNILTVIRAASSLLDARARRASDAARARAADRPRRRRARPSSRSSCSRSAASRCCKPESVDLNAVVDETLAAARPRDRRGHPARRPASGRALEPVLVDRGQLEQVILNLLVNARDAMPERRHARHPHRRTSSSRTRSRTEHVELGPGPYVVLAGHRHRRRHGRGDARARSSSRSSPPRTEGTGLGLATVYGIVTQSGGHICVDSEPGQGTHVQGLLPGRRRRSAAAPPAPADRRRRCAGSETVLLVEDASSCARSSPRCSSRTATRCCAAVDGDRGARARGRAPGAIDLLLTDVVMPRMSGRELADRLLVARPELRVLFMSGYPADTVVRHGVAESRVAFIQKPFVADDLAAAIRRVVEAAARA